MHVFRLAVPDLRRLGMLRSRASGVVSAAELTAMQRFLEQPGAPAVEILERVVGSAAELGAAAQELMDRGAQALWIPIDFVVYENMEPIVAAARPRRVPLVSSSLRGTNTGAVAGILVDYEMLGARAVVLALDILEKGAAPGDLPVGTMQGFQVVVNLGAARASGYELPIPLLAVADRILEDVEQERP
jgi:putative ABC transport system substrate-binding protein